ncbi:hypothetical protein AQUCO_01400506v1 [Aquilegia coerulea]|uniref:Knottin scorpion toxin-like domain-containing protein n=1 Tax=Aquilegia coerulea TaxID=218851 RepID=A0A2G5DWR1_AQUCA|nr:hypothetical protein AQUCO_01400506v1 [Aquilegia coerulea]
MHRMASKKDMLCKCLVISLLVLFLVSVNSAHEPGFDPKTHCKKICASDCDEDCRFAGFMHGRCVHKIEGPPDCCCF